MESFQLVRAFYHCLAEIGSPYKIYGSHERVGPPLGGGQEMAVMVG